MLKRQQDLYLHPDMLGLAVAERAALAVRARSCTGEHALQLTAFADDPPPSLPLLAHWVSLQIQARACRGDLRLDVDMPLPFVDECFEVIWLKHALDRSAHPAQLLASAVRLLAPGGTLLISGLHPLSGWALWSRFGRAGGGHLQAPWLLGMALRLSGLTLAEHWRQGSCWPHTHADLQRRSRLGGAYVLLARKERAQILPFVTRLAASRRMDAARLGAVQAAGPHVVRHGVPLPAATATCTLQHQGQEASPAAAAAVRPSNHFPDIHVVS